MPEHESQIKTIAAQPQKRKRHQVEEQEALSIMPATAMAMPQSQGKSTAGNSDKAKAYLVDYLAKNSKSDVVAKQPAAGSVSQTPVDNNNNFFKPVETGKVNSKPANVKTFKEAPRTGMQLSASPTIGLLKPSAKNTVTPLKVTSNPGDSLIILQTTPASRLATTLTTVKTNLLQSQQLKRTEAITKIPVVQESEGSIYGGKIKGLKKFIPKKGNAVLKNQPEQFKAPWQKDEPVHIPEAPVIAANTLSKLGSGSDEEAAAKANAELENVHLDTSSIPDSMGPQPEIDLSGEANPDMIDGELADQTEDVNTHKEDAAKEINNDFGENDVVPKPANIKIKANKKPASPKLFAGTALAPKPITGVTQQLDTALAPYVSKKMGEQKDSYDAEELKFQEQSTAEYAKADSDIAAESLKSRQGQFNANNAVVTDVNNARVQWRNELDGVEVKYKKDAGAASTDHKNQVNDKVKDGNKQIKEKYKEGDDEITRERKAAAEKAAAEKAKKRESSGGFWGWVKSKAAALVDLVKKAFNAIVSALRDAVKWVVSKIKAVVNFVIETVRSLVVGLIKVFGAVLKGLVSIAFAAFPEIRDRINSKIDSAVNKAVEITNAVFDTFKKVVNAIIDFVADLVDKLLNIIQKVISGILTLVTMIINGELGEIFKRLGYIVDAIRAVNFDTIKQGAVEELMGANLDEPLSPEELAAAQQMGIITTGESPALPQPPWTTANVGVDAVSNEELSPDLLAEITSMQRKGLTEMEIGNSTDPARSMEAVMKEAAAGGEQQSDTLGKQKQDDGLTPMRRAEIKWEMMKQGITQWWNKNWGYVVAGIIAALVLFIAAEIVTGGAITAALPVILPVLEYVFAGITIAQFGNYFVEFLEKAWNSGGQTKPATHALSRGLGAALIELAMYLGFGVLKAAGKAAKAIAKGAVKIGKQIFKGIIRGVKFLIEKAKVIFKGIAGKGLGKLSKSMRKLADDLLEHTRFKKFRIRFEGRRFSLEGFVNPWILLANGDLKEIAQDDLKALAKQKKTFKVGDGFKYIDEAGNEVEGIVVGSHGKPSTYVKQLDEIKTTKGADGLKDEYKVLQKELEAGGDLEKIIYNRQSTYELRKGMGEIPKNFQAHHIIPRELKDKFKDFFKKIGFDIENGLKNGMAVPPNKTVLKEAGEEGGKFANYAFHQGSHPNYTLKMEAYLDDIEIKFEKGVIKSPADAAKEVEIIVNKAKTAIQNGSGKSINNLIF